MIKTFVPFHREAADGHVQDLKEKALAHLATLFRESNRTQAEFAKSLGVSQPRISDALRGKHEKFTLDRLFEMLFAMGRDVRVEFSQLPSNGGASVKTRSEAENRELVGHYTAIIADDPADSISFGRRAWAYAQLGEWDKALNDWSRSAELNPERPGPRANRIMAYRKLGELSTALFECDRYERDFPGETVDSHRGIILADLGRYSEALEFYTADVLERPDRPGPYSNRAFLYLSLGEIEKARADFEQAHRIDPANTVYLEKLKELDGQI